MQDKRDRISQPLSRVIGDGAPLTPEERAEIEATARAATPGPWRAWGDDVFARIDGAPACIARPARCDGAKNLARHIARMDPPTTLRLLAALAAAEARAEAERAYRVARLAAIGEPNVHEAERRISETEAALRALGVEP